MFPPPPPSWTVDLSPSLLHRPSLTKSNQIHCHDLESCPSSSPDSGRSSPAFTSPPCICPASSFTSSLWEILTSEGAQKLLQRTGSHQCPCVGDGEFSVSMKTCRLDVEDASTRVDRRQTQKKKMVKGCHNCSLFFFCPFCFCTCMF